MLLWFCITTEVLYRKTKTEFTSFEPVDWVVVIGCLLAILSQHWAYYNIYKPAKESKKKAN